MASGGVWKGDKLTQLTVSWAEMSPGLRLAHGGITVTVYVIPKLPKAQVRAYLD